VGLVKTDEMDIISLVKRLCGKGGTAGRGLADENRVVGNEGIVVDGVEVHNLARDDQGGSERDPHITHDDGHSVGINHDEALLSVNNESGARELHGCCVGFLILFFCRNGKGMEMTYHSAVNSVNRKRHKEFNSHKRRDDNRRGTLCFTKSDKGSSGRLWLVLALGGRESFKVPEAG